MIEGMVNRTRVPCEVHQRQGLGHYLHSYIKNNSLDYEQHLKVERTVFRAVGMRILLISKEESN
jgi:hypothetical protein